MSEQQYDLFISYGRRDKNWAMRLKTALESKGLRVWIDIQEILPGKLWQDSLEEGVQSSSNFACVLSPDSVEKDWVITECQLAKRLGKPMIPILYQETDDTKWPAFLADRQYVDFRNDAQFEEGVAILAKTLGAHLTVGEQLDPQVSTPTDIFDKEYLCIVIAEDDEDDGISIKQMLMGMLRQWTWHVREQIAIDISIEPDLQSFQLQTQLLLQEGKLVYAILDLNLPRQTGQLPADVSEEIVKWCLNIKANNKRLEFCCVSGQSMTLTHLFHDSPVHDKLKAIKGIAKGDYKQLVEVRQDIIAFGLKNLKCATFTDVLGESMIWFGDKERCDLLSLAEGFVPPEQLGLKLLFSDGAGYELEWFRLVCFLRGVEPAILNCHVDNPMNCKWLQDPPPALFIGGVDRFDDKNFDIIKRFEETDFLGKVAAGKSLVIVQFPHFTSSLSINEVLDRRYERPFLEMCLNEIHPETNSEKGTDEIPKTISIPNSESVIHFPSYDQIKASHATRMHIDFVIQQCQKELSLPDAQLDDEVKEILANKNWNEFVLDPRNRNYGFEVLTENIESAFQQSLQELECQTGSRETLITRDMFLPEFNSRKHGVFWDLDSFHTTGDQLFDKLEKERKIGDRVERLNAGESLAQLQGILDIYDRLHRLVEWYSELKQKSHRLFDEDEFPEWKYRTLVDVYDFLVLVFQSPGELRNRISKFEERVEQRNWREFLPMLSRSRWWEVVAEDAQQWPLDRLSMHSDVYGYLTENRINTRVHAETKKVLISHEDLQGKWEEAEQNRRSILSEIQEREEQRLAAEHFVRDSRQPISERLERMGLEVVVNQSDYNQLLREFLMTNAGLAICESRLRFQDDRIPTSLIRSTIMRANIDNYYDVLKTYVTGFQEHPNFHSSFLRKWSSGWPSLYNQKDAVRLAKSLAKSFAEEIGTTLTTSIFHTIRELNVDKGECPVEIVLEFLLSIDKNVPQFWKSRGSDVLDFLRRFIAATTHSFRIGWYDEDSSCVYLWKLDERDRVDWDQSEYELEPDELYAFPEIEDKLAPPMFLVPFLGVHPEEETIYVHQGEGWWRNLAYQYKIEQTSEIPSENNPWLLSEREILHKLGIDE